MTSSHIPSQFELSHEKLDDFPLEDEDSVIIVLTYRCNSRCTFCIIETEIEAKIPETKAEDVDTLFARNRLDKTFSRLVLSGAEVTLRPDLAEIAKRATDEGGFEVVRIQTNARRLNKMDYLRTLFESGIREYFVSIHAGNAETDRRITRSSRSFVEMRDGLANLRTVGARVISNTVICRSNYRELPQIAEFILAEEVRELHFWAFLEMGDVGQEEELISIPEFMPYLKQALRIVEEAGASATVKWLPKCMLGEFAHLLDNHQPHMYIHEDFQQRLNDHFVFGCIHQENCSAFRQGCEGLHSQYRKTFGEEEEWLQPFGRTTQP
jgi:MoaA/NifB/PqqE/SkfB family radical SAM enzyme